MPPVEQEDALPYEKDQVDKLFAAMMDEGEKIRYKFFLGTACVTGLPIAL